MTASAQDKPVRLTKKAVSEGAAQLAERDPSLGRIFTQLGPPPLLSRPATYATFVHIVLEQQVSVESAKATFERLKLECGDDIRPQVVLGLGTERLRDLGFSRQKARYALALADDCSAGRFNIRSLSQKSDVEVRLQIVDRLGLGNWSADVFLMMALLRPDILPVGDLALVKGIQEIDGLEYPSAESVTERAKSWRPFRSIATRMVWQWYVHKRGRDIF